MHAETIRQALEKLDELEALVDNAPFPAVARHCEWSRARARARQASPH